MLSIPKYLTKEFVEKNVLTSTGKVSSGRLRKLPDIISVEQIYQVWHGLTGPVKCYCGNNTNFISFSQGYHTYCSAKCSANAPATLEKRKASNITKYGVEAYCQTEEFANSIATARENLPEEKKLTIIEKRSSTNLDRYGHKFVLQSPDVRRRGIETKIKKYGVEHAMQSSELLAIAQATRLAKWYPAKLDSLKDVVVPKFDASQYSNIDGKYLWACSKCATEFTSRLSDGRIPRCPTCFPYGYRSSKIEQEVASYLCDLGIIVKTSDRTIIAPQELDIVLPDHKIAIEVNGEYWHSELQGRGKEYHTSKTQACQEKGYRLIHMFASEWVTKTDLIKSRLQSILGLNQRLYGRNCYTSTLSHNNTQKFMDENHIQGNCASTINLGLFNKKTDELLAVMTFSKSRYNKTVQWELTRYASKKGINVVGGASKLFAHFIKAYNPESIISYCDLRWNTGNLYNMLGFTYSHTSPPNYKYTADYLHFDSRHKFQKHKLKYILKNFNPALTEWDNMKNNGWDRIWDCGNSVWVWKETNLRDIPVPDVI